MDIVQIVSSVTAEMILNDPCSTPVLRAVGILLDVGNTSRRSSISVTVPAGCPELRRRRSREPRSIFSDVKLFLRDMFDKDLNLYKVLLDLTIVALKAIGTTVGFYTSIASELSR